MTDIDDLIRLLREKAGPGQSRAYEYEWVRKDAADALEALQARVTEMERKIGGGCDATGGDHAVIAQGTYRFCAKCGESLRGVRYCHLPRASLAQKGE